MPFNFQFRFDDPFDPFHYVFGVVMGCGENGNLCGFDEFTMGE